MSKAKPLTRHDAICELLKNEAVTDQKQLVQLLKQQYKIETNQTVVSRDLRKLDVVKKQVQDQLVYQLPSSDITTEILKLAIMAIEYNETMIVIKTQPALAAFVGDCLDYFTDLDMIGCLAGENIVFIVPKSIKRIQKCYKEVCKRLHFIPRRSP